MFRYVRWCGNDDETLLRGGGGVYQRQVFSVVGDER